MMNDTLSALTGLAQPPTVRRNTLDAPGEYDQKNAVRVYIAAENLT